MWAAFSTTKSLNGENPASFLGKTSSFLLHFATSSIFLPLLVMHVWVEVSRWRDTLPSSLAPVPVFILLGHLLRSVVNAGTGKDWLSAQLCVDAVILLISETHLDLRSQDISLCPAGIPNEKKQIWSFYSSTAKREHLHTKQRTSYFIKMSFWIFHLVRNMQMATRFDPTSALGSYCLCQSLSMSIYKRL